MLLRYLKVVNKLLVWHHSLNVITFLQNMYNINISNYVVCDQI